MSDAADILSRIVAHKHKEIVDRSERVSLRELSRQIEGLEPCRGFTDALQATLQNGDAAVIAEIKRASPSKGVIRQKFDPTAIAQSYTAAGASCLSVLTDEKFFMGSDDYLKQVKATVELPVLRKDFTVDAYQIYEARLLGADCILLIAAVLGDPLLAELKGLASELGLDVLVEIHTREELERALDVGCEMIGVNNRDLKRFHTSIDTTLDLLHAVPEGVLLVTESGINERTQVETLRASGVHSFLVGEAFMRSPDPGQALRELFF